MYSYINFIIIILKRNIQYTKKLLKITLLKIKNKKPFFRVLQKTQYKGKNVIYFR